MNIPISQDYIAEMYETAKIYHTTFFYFKSLIDYLIVLFNLKFKIKPSGTQF